MGVPWYSKIVDGIIDWNIVGKSVDKYFAKQRKEGCCLVLNDTEIWMLDYDVIKVGDGEGNYYD